MNLNSTGETFIKSREALRVNAYPDAKGIPTIGWGTTVYPSGKRVKLGDVCTAKEAQDFFMYDIDVFETAVNKCIKIIGLKYTHSQGEDDIIYPDLTQNQFNALVSLCYNIGAPEFEKSTVVKRVNSFKRNDLDAITQAFYMWNKITVIRSGVKMKEVSPGLANRRAKEVALYFS